MWYKFSFPGISVKLETDSTPWPLYIRIGLACTKHEKPPMSMLVKLPLTSGDVTGSRKAISSDVTGILDIGGYSCLGTPDLYLKGCLYEQ
jgi:hypothetical protein